MKIFNVSLVTKNSCQEENSIYNRTFHLQNKTKYIFYLFITYNFFIQTLFFILLKIKFIIIY